MKHNEIFQLFTASVFFFMRVFDCDLQMHMPYILLLKCNMFISVIADIYPSGFVKSSSIFCENSNVALFNNNNEIKNKLYYCC